MARSPAIQTNLTRRFHLASDFLGPRRSGFRPQFIDPPRDFPKQLPRHGNPGQLERDVPPVTGHLGADLHQLLPRRRQQPVFHFLRAERLHRRPARKKSKAASASFLVSAIQMSCGCCLAFFRKPLAACSRRCPSCVPSSAARGRSRRPRGAPSRVRTEPAIGSRAGQNERAIANHLAWAKVPTIWHGPKCQPFGMGQNRRWPASVPS